MHIASVAKVRELEFHLQRDNSTRMNRYPEIFEIVRNLCVHKNIQSPRILSFGCSKGDEPYTLKTRYFPDSKIVGLDVAPEMLRIAREERGVSDKIIYDLSTPQNLEKYGPYDIIFAMSVLCRWPDLARSSNCNHLFPFDQYTESVDRLHRSLNLGGILVIYNSNYAFSDTHLINCYDFVLDDNIKTNGFVKHFDKHGDAIENYRGVETIYIKKHEEPSVSEYIDTVIVNGNGRSVGKISSNVSRTSA